MLGQEALLWHLIVTRTFMVELGALGSFMNSRV